MEDRRNVLNPTAARILDAAARLFMQRGYSAVSINDIVRAAAITKPTLYYHFPDKEELFVQMVLRMLSEMREAIERSLERKKTLDERLLALAEVIMNHRDGDMHMLRHEMKEHLNPEHQRRLGMAFHSCVFSPIHNEMQQQSTAGALSGHSPAELAWLFLGLMDAFRQPAGTESDSFADEPFTPQITPATVVDLFLYGAAGRRQYPE